MLLFVIVFQLMYQDSTVIPALKKYVTNNCLYFTFQIYANKWGSIQNFFQSSYFVAVLPFLWFIKKYNWMNVYVIVVQIIQDLYIYRYIVT